MDTTRESYLEYHRNYYRNVYKEKIKNEKVCCDLCNKEFTAWNINKHKLSKKHLLNLMGEENKKKYLEEDRKYKIIKKIQDLENLLKIPN
jgi:hypothetical protein